MNLENAEKIKVSLSVVRNFQAALKLLKAVCGCFFLMSLFLIHPNNIKVTDGSQGYSVVQVWTSMCKSIY